MKKAGVTLRERIQQLANGKFVYEKPEVVFSTDRIDIEMAGGKDYTGEFTITSTNGVPMKGLVYTSHSRMECLTPRIEGEEARVSFRFHSAGLTGGDIRKGDFFFVLNQGEYNLSYVVAISRVSAETSVGKIGSISDFVHLAKEEPQEAAKLFYSPNFKNIMKKGERRELLLYEGLSRGTQTMQKVEEFLVGIHRKKPVSIRLSKPRVDFGYVSQDTREQVELLKNDWGYMDLRVTTDVSFLAPVKDRLTSEDFLGSICMFEYYIRKDRLHAGKNYGRLIFWLFDQKVIFEVSVRGDREHDAKEAPIHRQVQQAHISLAQLYVDYRLKKIVTGIWARQSIEQLNHLIALGSDTALCTLMKAQALLMNKQRQEAEWLMDEFKRRREQKNTPVWGYYLYLCTLMEREPSYVDRLASEIERIYMENRRSSLLFWVLLYMKEEYYRNPPGKLKALKQWIINGHNSPYYYVEVYYLYQKEPYLIRELGSFEIKILFWAVRQHVMTESIVRQVISLLPKVRTFLPFLYKILESCYQVLPSKEMLEDVCGYLIRCQRYGKEYIVWYERGIGEQLMLTGLYEAYLMSLDSSCVVEVPKMLQMYFRYDNMLPANLKAVLFVNIILQKEKQPEIYRNYKSMVEQFAMEQIEAGHIDENLAVIYQEILKSGFLNEELAIALSKIIFTWKISCINPDICHAVILDRWQREPQVVSFINGTAYFKAYSGDFCVLLCDGFGNWFTESIVYQTQPLIHVELYVDRCHELAPTCVEYMLYMILQKRGSEILKNNSDIFIKFIKTADIGENYRMELLLDRIELCQVYGYQDDIKRFLPLLDVSGIAVAKRREVICYLAEYGMIDKAYGLVRDFGYDYLEGPAREKICTHAVIASEFEEDDLLLGLACSVFFDGGGNESILIYLCRFYQGPTKHMAQIWKAAEQLFIDTFELEERILTQMLYTTDYIGYAEEIYDSYQAGGGKEQICDAYLTYYANTYITKDALIPARVFLQILERYQKNGWLNETCKIGLMKYFSEAETLSEVQNGILEIILRENIERGIYFGFYRRYEERLLREYLLFDKWFVEYHTKPYSVVSISYRKDGGEFCREEMTEMYDGIYVKEFILFYGEAIQYYITENGAGQDRVTQSGCLEAKEIPKSIVYGAYGRINLLLEKLSSERPADSDLLKQDMKEYALLNQFVEERFRLV